MSLKNSSSFLKKLLKSNRSNEEANRTPQDKVLYNKKIELDTLSSTASSTFTNISERKSKRNSFIRTDSIKNSLKKLVNRTSEPEDEYVTGRFSYNDQNFHLDSNANVKPVIYDIKEVEESDKLPPKKSKFDSSKNKKNKSSKKDNKKKATFINSSKSRSNEVSFTGSSSNSPILTGSNSTESSSKGSRTTGSSSTGSSSTGSSSTGSSSTGSSSTGSSSKGSSSTGSRSTGSSLNASTTSSKSGSDEVIQKIWENTFDTTIRTEDFNKPQTKINQALNNVRKKISVGKKNLSYELNALPSYEYSDSNESIYEEKKKIIPKVKYSLHGKPVVIRQINDDSDTYTDSNLSSQYEQYTKKYVPKLKQCPCEKKYEKIPKTIDVRPPRHAHVQKIPVTTKYKQPYVVEKKLEPFYQSSVVKYQQPHVQYSNKRTPIDYEKIHFCKNLINYLSSSYGHKFEVLLPENDEPMVIRVKLNKSEKAKNMLRRKCDRINADDDENYELIIRLPRPRSSTRQNVILPPLKKTFMLPPKKTYLPIEYTYDSSIICPKAVVTAKTKYIKPGPLTHDVIVEKYDFTQPPQIFSQNINMTCMPEVKYVCDSELECDRKDEITINVNQRGFENVKLRFPDGFNKSIENRKNEVRSKTVARAEPTNVRAKQIISGNKTCYEQSCYDQSCCYDPCYYQQQCTPYNYQYGYPCTESLYYL